MMTEPLAIRTNALTKQYGRLEALAGVDLAIPEGSMVLLVGPNGAGKTTLIRLLLDLIPRTSGTLQVLGRDPRTHGSEVRAGVGFLSEAGGFPFDHMRIRDFLDFQSRFRPTWDEAYARRMADLLELRMDRKWKGLSKGEARRAQIVAALAHRPPLLLLDEATDGLDPLVRETVLGLISEHLADTGATILYCTHVIHEVQRLPDRLVALSGGRIRVDEEVEVLRRTIHRLRFRVPGGPGEVVSPPPNLVRIEARTESARQWILRGVRDEILAWASTSGIEVDDLAPVSVADAALAYLAPRGTEPDAAPSDPLPLPVEEGALP
jgi:ABC-2 type transport system ATP-binding protein